ncbi:MAG: nitroreductase family protein [Bacteroidota bacterium]
MDLLQKLNWRYATKRMNGQIVPEQNLNNILDAIQLAPSSAGLQPYNVIVVSDKEVLKQIHQESAQQPQILEASHLLVFAAWKNLSEEQVEEYINRIAATRNIPAESLDGFKSNIMGFTKRTAEQNYQWAARQAYIGLGVAAIAAAHEQVDATPMEGFNPAAMDKILGLEERGLGSVAIMPLGYRDEANDFLLGAKKVRRSKENFFTKI